MPEFIKSNYGSRITVQEEEDREILLDLGDERDVLISPEAALELSDWLRKTAYQVLERMEDKRDQ
ncbi:hypothetical protein [Streptomyces globisporus]|uniref:hypothetical protein n=1 Tax=Streptomyces globisporus TaxID=1908 RepID=UPI00368B50AA